MDTAIVVNKDNSNIKTDSYFKLTVSKLYRVNGATAQAKGVQPDVVLPDMLEARPQREADNPYVLISTPIEGNKYFKPYPAMNIDNLKALAEQKINASSYFQQLKKYIQSEKAKDENKEVSLKLSDAIEEEKKSAEENIDTASVKTETAPYTIENNSFEKEQLKVNENLKEINDQWAKFLKRDPYLQIAYDMMLLMIK